MNFRITIATLAPTGSASPGGTRDIELIVTTEKDLVKLENFPFARGKLVALRIVPEVDDGGALVRMITQRTGLSQAP